MSANDEQVGGTHYKRHSLQPWDVIADMGLDFFQGCIFKYVVRYKSKGGVQDLEKARHYLDKLIELERGRDARGEDQGGGKTPAPGA